MNALRTLALLALVAVTSVTGLVFAKAETGKPKTFKAVFTLKADDAKLTGDVLTLSGVAKQVFVVESEGADAVGVTAPSAHFLKRWQSIDHSIEPNGILFAERHEHDQPYQALNFAIDDPRPVGEPDANTSRDAKNWAFDVSHVRAEAKDKLSEGVALGPVTLTVVMVHTQKEFDLGLVCGPWDLDELEHHLDLLDS